SLARVINEEPVQSRDLEMMGTLLPLGLEKGKEVNPDPATRTLLKDAAAEAQAWLIEGIVSTCERYWPDGKWNIPAPPIAIKTEFLWEVPTTSTWIRVGSPLPASSGQWQSSARAAST